MHHTWHRQVKRIATFLMRFFFACSIGFTIPVEDFGDGEVWGTALALFAWLASSCPPLFEAEACYPGFHEVSVDRLQATADSWHRNAQKIPERSTCLEKPIVPAFVRNWVDTDWPKLHVIFEKTGVAVVTMLLLCLLLRCILGKLAMGIFALPLTKNELLTLSFAWGSWGEFSFILALRAVRGNLLDGRGTAVRCGSLRSVANSQGGS